MADDEQILVVGSTRARSLWKSLRVASGARAVECRICDFVAGLGADERCGLEAALEGAGDDEVELDVQGVQHVRELEAVLLAFFVEGALDVEEGIRTSESGAGVSKNIEIHNLFTF